MAALEARGASAYRFDTDRFPADIQLTVGWDAEDRIILSDSAMELDLGTVSAVWIRGMDAGAKHPADLDPGHHDIAQAEAASMIWGMLESLNAFQLDPPDNLRCAPHKPRQLQLARAVGLEIPRTLITSDPQAVREFGKTCRHGMIAKMVDGAGVRVQT